MSSPQPTSQTIVISTLLLLVAGSECSADAISNLVDQVSQSQYTTYQRTIERMGLGEYGGADYDQGFRDRFVDEAGRATLGNQEARLYLSDQLTSMELDVSTQGLYQNVVGVKQGVVAPDQVYIVCAHYDTYEGSIDDERPGGEDNASGTAGMLEVARVLSQYEFESTIRFIGFNAEEIDLLGSHDYVDNVLVASGENVVGVINLDVIFGTFSFPLPPTPADLDVVTAPSSPDPDEPHCPECADWANTFIQAANTYVPTLPIDPDSPFGNRGAWPIWALSDQRSFLQQGYPTIWTFGGTTEYIHGPEDASDGLAGDFFDYAFATDVVSAVAATIAQEANLIPDLIGDFNENGMLDASDIDLLACSPLPDRAFDLNGNGLVDHLDHRMWVKDLKCTWYGDANLNGEFNSSDMVQVFASGKYETSSEAGWSEGDWNGDCVFDSSDMVTAFVDGGYEKGPPMDVAGVPEPTSVLLLMTGLVGVAIVRRPLGS